MAPLSESQKDEFTFKEYTCEYKRKLQGFIGPRYRQGIHIQYEQL